MIGSINIELLGIGAAFLTLIIALAGLYVNIRNEFRKNWQALLQNKLSDEKRCHSNEQRIALIEERLQLTDANITYRLDEIKSGLEKVTLVLMNHISEKHR